MATAVTPLRRKTIIGWMLACIAVLGLLGYEWLPSHLRGGWVLYLLLLASGAFLRIGQALVFGLMAFVATALFMFYRASIGLPIEQLVLALVLNAAAPLWLSAIYHNLELRRGASAALLLLSQRTQSSTLNLAASERFIQQLDALCRRLGVARYWVVDVGITNHRLILELLGEQAWQSVRLRVLALLEAYTDEELFVFVDEELTQLRLVVFGPKPEGDGAPQLLRQLARERELILEVRIAEHLVSQSTGELRT